MPFVETWLAQLAAMVSAAAATGAFAAALSTLILVRRHDRTLYGEGAIQSDQGLVHQVDENVRRIREHRQTLRRSAAVEEVFEDG